ncbi:MAG TPA: N-6 DNA methylase [Nannocystaceae bacterium]|nr:N-6 DNA methylase [Nannocystaceae bacterium]
MIDRDKETRFHDEWLGQAQPYEGLVFSTPVLADAQIAPSADPQLTARFRAHLAHTPDPAGRGRPPLLAEPIHATDCRRLFADFLGYDRPGMLVPQDALPPALRFYAEEGRQELRPTFAIARTPAAPGKAAAADDDLFAGFGEPEPAPEPAPAPTESPGESPYLALVWDLTQSGPPIGLSLDKPEDTTGPWRYPPTAKLERLLRHTKIPIGLLYSGSELRLVYAPPAESTSHLTFRFAHMAEPAGRPLLAAFELLLGARRTYGAAAAHTLEGLLRESRRRQADVTQGLAAQVFEAVELLLEGFESAALRDRSSETLDWLRAALDAPRDHLYRGVLSVILRLVFILYAEDQALLPVGHRLYAEHLSVQGLYDALVADAGMHPESMRSRFGAYGRLLTLFRAVFLGVRHKDLLLPPRQGQLFNPSTFPFLEGGLPGEAAAINLPEQRAEVRPPQVDDGVILEVLRRLIVYGGQRLSYATLDVEQVGSVYESLMGYHVLRTGSPAVRLGKNAVWVECAALRELRPQERQKWLQDTCDLSAAQLTKVEAALAEHPDDTALAEALVAEGLTPGGKRERDRHRVPQGRLVLQPGDERRRSGSHYTPRSLTERIVRRTLEPLLACLGPTPTADQILSLKICDPAMGSGAFLVETCRHLADQVVAAWTREGTIAALTERYGEARVHARRLIAQRCLYGVDKNDAAVELAKLSLWLVTMSRELPFTFVDHALRHGDSLVGLDLDQIAAFHWRPAAQATLFTPLLKDALDQAIAHRKEIHERAEHEDNSNQQEKRRLLDRAEHATAKIRMIADLCVGAFFKGDKDKAREEERARRQALIERWIKGEDRLEPELRALADEIREQHAPFHWWLEFPEVFYEARPDPLDGGKVNGAAYMEGFVGNPPFAGKNTITIANGPAYLDWLMVKHPEVKGHANTDLSAYFFRRAAELIGPNGTIGFVATNTIAQGDSRLMSLKILVDAGARIYDGVSSFRWPGAAAVAASTVHLAIGLPSRVPLALVLDGQAVSAINSRLNPKPERSETRPLRANADIAFMGGKLVGVGLAVDEDEYAALIKQSAKNSQILRPYIGGEDVNSSPTGAHSRYVIDFTRHDLEEAKKWPALLKIVEERVKPARMKDNRGTYKTYWWKPGESGGALYQALSGLSNCLVTARVTKHLCFSLQPTIRFFSEALYIFALSTHTAFAVLQSRVHEPWARLLSSSMKTDLRYAASDCFDTFPFPGADPREVIPEVEEAGREFYEERARFMVATEQGLTKTYNALKDPGNSDPAVLRLRRLTEAMDRAVLRAYGWTDLADNLPPYCPLTPTQQTALQTFQDEVIDRLYQLNAHRAALEAQSQTPNPKPKKPKSPKPPPTPQGTLF